MSRFRIVCTAALSIALVLFTVFIVDDIARKIAPRAEPLTVAPPLPISTVKVIIANGHGSGVHLGDGFVLTAAHVVQSNKTVKLKTQDGAEVEATVLWANSAYDAALVYAPTLKAQHSVIVCRAPVVGEAVRASGNPRHVEFAQTWGRIAGWGPVDPQDHGNVVVNITFIGGMSGGPVFDENNDVIGIVQAVLGQTAFGFMVPTSAICHLFGRVL